MSIFKALIYLKYIHVLDLMFVGVLTIALASGVILNLKKLSVDHDCAWVVFYFWEWVVIILTIWSFDDFEDQENNHYLFLWKLWVM